MPKHLAMSSPDYEIDEQEKTVTPEEARRFLRVLAFSEVWSVGVAALAAYFAFPGKPLLIVAAAVVWAIVSLGVWLYMRGHVERQVKRPY